MAARKKTASKKKAVATTKENRQMMNPDDIRKQAAEEAGRINDALGNAAGVRIRTEGGRFHLPDGTQSSEPIQAVILDFCRAHAWYAKPFVKGQFNPPDCFALAPPAAMLPAGTKAEDIIYRSDKSPQPMHDGPCKECPLNEFGSDRQGRAGKDCQNRYNLAVVPPDDDWESSISILSVSPTAMKAFDEYVRRLASAEATVCMVVTELSLVQQGTYSILHFKEVEPNDNLGVHWERRKEAWQLLEQEPDVAQAAATAKKGGGQRARGRRRTA